MKTTPKDHHLYHHLQCHQPPNTTKRDEYFDYSEKSNKSLWQALNTNQFKNENIINTKFQ